MTGVTIGALATAGWEAYTHFAKGGKQNVSDTGLSHLPDEVIDQRANDRTLTPGERQRYQKEQKARKKRNEQPRRKQRGIHESNVHPKGRGIKPKLRNKRKRCK